MVKISLENGTSINIDTRDNINNRSQESFTVTAIIFGLILLAWAGISISDKIKEKKAKDAIKKQSELVDKIKKSPEFKETISKIDLITKQTIKTYNEAVTNIKSNNKLKKYISQANKNITDISKYIIKNTEKSIKDELVKQIADQLFNNEKLVFYYYCSLFDMYKLNSDINDVSEGDYCFDDIIAEIVKSIPTKTIDKHLTIDPDDSGTWELIDFSVNYYE